MDIPGLGGCKCVEKGVRFLDPCFQKILPLFPKNIGLGFWVGFDIWLRLAKNAMKRGWETGVPVLLGMKRLNPGCVGPGDRAKIQLW